MGIALTQTPPQYTQYVAQAFEWFKEHDDYPQGHYKTYRV